MPEQALSRIHILFEQGRFAEAEKILLTLLPTSPDNPLLLSYLAETKLQLDENDAAEHYTNAALALQPDNPMLFFLKARIRIHEDNLEEAETYLLQATHLDPEEPEFPALLASIMLDKKQYHEALELSDRALELNPEHVLALNNRSMALLKLKRSAESYETIEGALHEAPDNAYNHANYGWILLEKGDRKKALEHFREALRNDPNSNAARSGMAEALKATNPLYKLFLRYSFWIGNLTERYQWGVIIGFYIAFRVLRGIANEYESLQPVLYPVLILLGLMAFSTWIITPISNLFLRLNRYGRFLLDKKELMSSNFVGAALIIVFAGVILYFILKDPPWLGVAAFGLTMMIPLSSMLTPVRTKNFLIYYTIGMAVIGSAAILKSFQSGELFNTFSIIYVAAFVVFQWVANYMIAKSRS